MPDIKLIIRLSGPFWVGQCEDVALTPRSAKSQGLLALLATSPKGHRSRIWLQDKLWSDRGKEQGAASLRQALTEIRKSLGSCASAFGANRNSVWLDPMSLDVLDDPSLGEFLEGLDVRDNEFELWLQNQRQSRHHLVQPAPNLGIATDYRSKDVSLGLYRIGPANTEAERTLGDIFSDSAGQSLNDALSISVTRIADVEEPAAPPCDGAHALLLGYSVRQVAHGLLSLRGVVTDGRSRAQVFAGSETIALQGGLPEDHWSLMAFSNQIVDAIGDHLLRRSTPRDPQGAPLTFALGVALRHIFSMTQEGFEAGDAILESASAISPEHDLILAWRAHLRAIALVERQAIDPQVYLEEGRHFAAEAQIRSHRNSVALAALANARLILDGNVTACDEFSAQAVQLNPAAPLGWWSRSAAHLYSGEYDRAYKAASRAAALTGPSPYRFWWDFQRGLTAAMTGRISESVDQTRRASINGPRFRPALRYLTALHSLTGDTANARATAEKLRALEPDFHPDRLASDPGYPASLMRRKGIVQQDIGRRLM